MGEEEKTYGIDSDGYLNKVLLIQTSLSEYLHFQTKSCTLCNGMDTIGSSSQSSLAGGLHTNYEVNQRTEEAMFVHTLGTLF
jgi:hypothetical protein